MTVAKSEVYIFQTADTRACIVGCIKFRDHEYVFVLGRFHFSGLQNLDLDITTYLIMMTKFQYAENMKMKKFTMTISNCQFFSACYNLLYE